ncbi:MAG: hypothetical protein ABTS22_01095, partial [Accumulibacter sp.]|uniref:hypothetical protein n=1 Tax=Accumulibacter sp. TaxID=2053492 RepID=UPI003314C810
SNNHDSTSLVSYCEGIPKDKHEISVAVSQVPGYKDSDCYTGWAHSRWLLEVEEVLIKKTLN